MTRMRTLSLFFVVAIVAAAAPAFADETCNSPYMGNLIKGQEDYVYVWALGVEVWVTDSTTWCRSTSTPSPRLIARSMAQSGSARAVRRTTWASPTTPASSGPAG